MPRPKSRRVVIIGAGVGGLSAAVRLAAQGHRVTVYEQAATVGGKLGTYRRDGFVFDTGPSLLTLPAVYRDLFVNTGKPLEDVLDLVSVDPVAHYRFADGTELDVPNADLPGTVRAFDAAFGPGAGEDWRRFLDRADEMWGIVRGPFLESPLGGIRGLLRQAGLRELTAVAPWRTLRGLGRRYLRDPRLRMFLDRYATYSGSDPRHAPAALSVVPYVEQTFGAWYLRGGLGTLGAALAERAQELGATISTGTEVLRIETTRGRVTGVRLRPARHDSKNSSDDRTGAPTETDTDTELVVEAEIVVANADASVVYERLLPRSVARGQRARLRRAPRSLAGFVLLLALRGRTPALRHHTVLFPADYDEEFDAIFGAPARPPTDPTIYLSAPDDPALRPDEDSEAIFVLVNAPRHSPSPGKGTVDWDEPGLAERYADHILATMAARGLDLRERIRWREVRTPATLERETGSPGGAIYGTSSNGARAAFLRPANRSSVGGLYLVGGSAHPGGGLPLVGLSASIVAGLIEQDNPRDDSPELPTPPSDLTDTTKSASPTLESEPTHG